MPMDPEDFRAQLMDVAIPGQSLTKPSGGSPWEQPPMFTDPEKALEALIASLTSNRGAEKLLNLLRIGVPVKAIVYTLLMSGSIEGKWTVPMAVILSQPLTAFVLKLAKKAKIKPVIGTEDRKDPTKEALVKAVEKRGAPKTFLRQKPGPGLAGPAPSKEIV